MVERVIGKDKRDRKTYFTEYLLDRFRALWGFSDECCVNERLVYGERSYDLLIRSSPSFIFFKAQGVVGANEVCSIAKVVVDRYKIRNLKTKKPVNFTGELIDSAEFVLRTRGLGITEHDIYAGRFFKGILKETKPEILFLDWSAQPGMDTNLSSLGRALHSRHEVSFLEASQDQIEDCFGLTPVGGWILDSGLDYRIAGLSHGAEGNHLGLTLCSSNLSLEDANTLGSAIMIARYDYN